MVGIEWSNEARDDLDGIFLRIESESAVYAEKWIKDLFAKIELIQKFPQLGRMLPEMGVLVSERFLLGNTG